MLLAKPTIFGKNLGVKHISSTQNPLIKSIAHLQDKSRARRDSGMFVLEGVRELQLAVKAGYRIEKLLYLPELAEAQMAAELAQNAEVLSVSHDVYRKIAYRESTEGLLAVVRAKDHAITNLKLRPNPLILIAEAPEKPGNIGALLRTADAAGLDAVIIANPRTDLYNPNIIRSSVGCVFTVPVALGSTSEILSFLNDNNIALYAAALQDSSCYSAEDYRGATALAVGTEDVGLSEAWRTAARKIISIPMSGQIDSMNVSVAAAILVFEACRQRGFK